MPAEKGEKSNRPRVLSFWLLFVSRLPLLLPLFPLCQGLSTTDRTRPAPAARALPANASCRHAHAPSTLAPVLEPPLVLLRRRCKTSDPGSSTRDRGVNLVRGRRLECVVASYLARRPRFWLSPGRADLSTATSSAPPEEHLLTSGASSDLVCISQGKNEVRLRIRHAVSQANRCSKVDVPVVCSNAKAVGIRCTNE